MSSTRTPPPLPPEARRRLGSGKKPPPIPAAALKRKVTEAPVVSRSVLPPPLPPEALVPRKRTLPEPREAEARARDASRLVDAAKGGDGRAFDELVRRYRPRILALALHLTGCASEAEDIAQDAFLKAYRNLARFEGRSAFFTWVYRIALNQCLQTRARRRAHPGVDMDDPRVELAVAVDAARSPASALELREDYAELVFAFDRLSPLLRTTVALTTLQGLSHPEAAVVLETTEGTIAWRMHEARNQLRAALAAVAASRTRPARIRRQSGEFEAPRDAHGDESAEALAMALVMVFA